MNPFGFPDKTQDYPQAQGLVVTVINPMPAVFVWDLINWQNVEGTLVSNVTFNKPVGIKKGRFYFIELIQDATGSRLITWNAAYLNVSTLTLQTTAAYSNCLTFKARSDTTLELVGNYTTTGVA